MVFYDVLHYEYNSNEYPGSRPTVWNICQPPIIRLSILHGVPDGD